MEKYIPPRSKRSIRSDQYAQHVCRELRYQLTQPGPGLTDPDRLLKLLHQWMHNTGKVKYERPL